MSATLSTIAVYNAAGQLAGVVDDAIDYEIIDRFGQAGEWRANVDAARCRSLLTPGATIAVSWRGVLVFCGLVGTELVERLAFGGGRAVLEVSGPSLESAYLGVLCYPAPTLAGTAQVGGATLSLTGTASTVVRTLLVNQIGPTADATRQAAVTFAADPAVGATVSDTAQMEPLRGVVDRLCAAGGVTVRGTRTPTGVTLTVAGTRNRTAAIRLAPETGTVSGYTLATRVPTATRVLVGDAGTGAARVFKAATDTTAETRWLARRENFVDHSQTTSATVLQTQANADLADATELALLAVDIVEGPRMYYGVDVIVGDLVTVAVAGVEQQLVVTEAHLTANVTEGPRVRLAVGGINPDDGARKLARSLNGISRRITRLEARR